MKRWGFNFGCHDKEDEPNSRLAWVGLGVLRCGYGFEAWDFSRHVRLWIYGFEFKFFPFLLIALVK